MFCQGAIPQTPANKAMRPSCLHPVFSLHSRGRLTSRSLARCHVMFLRDAHRSHPCPHTHHTWHQASRHPLHIRPPTSLVLVAWHALWRENISSFKYISSCSTCAMSKVHHSLPASKLVPLLLPSHPRSYTIVDLITDLPISQSNRSFLSTVDCFSKFVILISLPELPAAFQTAQMLSEHVFCHYGIPEDIVSYCRFQFTSHV